MKEKLSEELRVRMPLIMADWLDQIIVESQQNAPPQSRFRSRSELVRSLLQTIMNEDIAAHQRAAQ